MLLQVRLSDVSGMDLSGACFSDVDMLVGITWTDDTSWPPNVANWVRDKSRELGLGIYLVKGGGEWNPADVPVDA